MLNKLEKKFGKYAIPNLMKVLITGYVIGYVLSCFTDGTSSSTSIISLMALEPYYIIYRLQLWRLFTWVMVPDGYGLFFFLIMLFLYYQLGNALERTWGTFRFNLYIFGGIIFTVIGAFILYGVLSYYSGSPFISVNSYFSMQYINLSIFLAFAATYPSMRVMLYFILPVPMWLMAVIYGGIIGYSLIYSNWIIRVAIISSLLNFLIFFLATRNYKRIDPKEAARRAKFKQAYQQGAKQQRQRQQQQYQSYQHYQQQFGGQSFGQQSQYNQQGNIISRHRCAVCGRTEITNPELEFRFCSKCNGNYEYCSDHLFSHPHVNS